MQKFKRSSIGNNLLKKGTKRKLERLSLEGSLKLLYTLFKVASTTTPCKIHTQIIRKEKDVKQE